MSTRGIEAAQRIPNPEELLRCLPKTLLVRCNSLPDCLLSLPTADKLKKLLAPALAPERCPIMCLIKLDQAA